MPPGSFVPAPAPIPASAPLWSCALPQPTPSHPAPAVHTRAPAPWPVSPSRPHSGWPPPPPARGRRCGVAGRAAGAGTPGGGGAARAPGAQRRARGRHGVALHQPPLLPGAALEPAGPLRRCGAADPAQLLRPRERGAGPRRRRLGQGPVPRRRPGSGAGRAAHSVPAGLRRVAGAGGTQRCAAGAPAGGGQPQRQIPRTRWPGDLRAPHRRRERGCSSDHVVQVRGWGRGPKRTGVSGRTDDRSLHPTRLRERQAASEVTLFGPWTQQASPSLLTD